MTWLSALLIFTAVLLAWIDGHLFGYAVANKRDPFWNGYIQGRTFWLYRP